MKLAFVDPRFLNNLIIYAILPFLISVIFNKSTSAASHGPRQEGDDPFSGESTNVVTQNTGEALKKQFWGLFFVFTLLFTHILQFSTGMAIRLQELESRIRQFLFTNRGSKLAYIASLTTLDVIVTSVVSVMLLIFHIVYWKKENYFDNIGYSIKLTFVVVMQIMNNTLFTGYITSYVFSTYKAFVTYQNFLCMGGFSLLASLVYLSLDYNESTFLTILMNYLSFHRASINAIIAITDFSMYQRIEELKKANMLRNGGYTFNLFIVLIHSAILFLVVLKLESWRYNYHQSMRESSGEINEADLHNDINAHIIDEEEVEAEERNVGLEISNQCPSKGIQVYRLWKKYKGKAVPAVRGASFRIQQGQVMCLLGPNGAGKSSILDIMCGIKSKTSGRIIYGQKDLHQQNFEKLSFCLQDNFLWDHLTFAEHIWIIGRWRGLSSSFIARLVSELDRALDVGESLNIKAMSLSGGNKRKLNTALALLSTPRFFVLDEPTAGIDPSSRRFFWSLIQSYKAHAAILLTTHTVNEAEVISSF